MMKFAKKDGVTEENVLQDEKITLRERKGKKEKKIIHREDEEKFIEYCVENKYIDILMLVFSGVRSSELAGMTWKCLDLEENVIKIKEEYLWVDETDFVDGKIVVTDRVKKVTDVKTDGSDRKVTLTNSFIELLKQHKERQKELARSKGRTFKESDFIFTTKNYNGYISDFTYDKFKSIVNTLKIKGYKELTPHCLRHSFCSRGIREGVELKEMSELLGHSNIGVTADWYTQLDDEQLKQASNKTNRNVDKYLEKAIKNNTKK